MLSFFFQVEVDFFVFAYLSSLITGTTVSSLFGIIGGSLLTVLEFPLELSPIPGENQAVHTEAVVEVSVELSALPAAERVVVHSPVKMQALVVIRCPRLRPAAAGVVWAQGRYVPIRQLVHQSEGPLSAWGPRAERGHVAIKVVETWSGRGESGRR